jgi:hypothetical protein
LAVTWAVSYVLAALREYLGCQTVVDCRD